MSQTTEDVAVSSEVPYTNEGSIEQTIRQNSPEALPNYPIASGAVKVLSTNGEKTATARKLTIEEITLMLEQLLSRDAILNQRNAFITNLITFSASPDLSVSASSLLSHPELSLASEDEILMAAKESSIVSVDMTRKIVIPELKSKRNTLILRETNPSTTPIDILTLLAKCPDLTVDSSALTKEPLDAARCCYALSAMMVRLDSWFLTFKDEDVAASVAWWLRDQQLLDTPVQVRIKSEAALRLDLIPTITSPPRVGGRPFRRWRGSAPPVSKPRGTWNGTCKLCHKATDGNSPQQDDDSSKRCTCPPPSRGTRGSWRRGGRGGRTGVSERRVGHVRSHGDRSGKPQWGSGRMREGSTAEPTAVPQQERIVVVTPSEFPPLCDGPLQDGGGGAHCGYAGLEYRQHTMQVVRSICDKLPPINRIPPGIDAILAEGYQDGLAAVFTKTPRAHQWGFEALNYRATTAAGRVRKLRHLEVASTETDGAAALSGSAVVAPGTTSSREFWAKQRSKTTAVIPTVSTTESQSKLIQQAVTTKSETGSHTPPQGTTNGAARIVGATATARVNLVQFGSLDKPAEKVLTKES